MLTTTGALVWSVGEEKYLYNNKNLRVVKALRIFQLTAFSEGGRLVSSATASGVTAEDDGVNVTCADNVGGEINSQTAVLQITGL